MNICSQLYNSPTQTKWIIVTANSNLNENCHNKSETKLRNVIAQHKLNSATTSQMLQFMKADWGLYSFTS